MATHPNTVYLSKSNHSNPDQVMKVRKWLDEKGFTIIEHQGGVYDESLLRKARIMVMVGCNKIENGFTAVGKGQYGQLKDRVNHGLLHNYYVAGKIYGNIILRKVLTDKIVDETNWTHNYGTLRVKMESTIRISTSHEPKPNKNPDSQIDGGQDMMKQAEHHFVPKKSCIIENGIDIHLACITLFK